MARPLRSRVLAAVLVGGLCAAAAAQESLGDRMDALLARYHELELFDGAALVARHDDVLLDRGYGFANREFRIPNGGDVRYRLASVSKTFTALLVMQLVDQGRLSLDATLSDVLPEYRRDTGARVTIRELLNHSSGIPDYFRAAGGWAAFSARMGTTPVDRSSVVTSLCSGDLEFEPGSRWSYSNCGYFLLGLVVEKVTGEPYDRVLQSRVLDPAGMHDTGDESADPHAVVERFASCYVRTPGGVKRQSYWNMTTAFATGALYSTPRDLLRYDRALADETLLSNRAMEQMLTPGVGGYGLGWEIRELPIGPGGEPRRIATHEGFLFGSHTRIYRVLDDGVVVVLLSNAGNSPLEAMATGLLDLLYGRDPVRPKPSVGNEVRRVLVASGPEAAAARYRALRVDEPEGWEFGERELNQLGYALLGAGRVDDALAVFRLNLEAFPESGNCHDSLAEALAAAGRKDEAVREYARSLELEPGNRNAVEKLAQLVGTR